MSSNKAYLAPIKRDGKKQVYEHKGFSQLIGYYDERYVFLLRGVAYNLIYSFYNRQGEVLGLKWEDIMLNDACIYVNRSLAYVVGQGHILQNPKSKSSKRKILILSEDIEMLKKYKLWQREQAALLRNKYVDNGLVFTNTFGNPLDISNFVNRYFKPLLKPAGIDKGFTFHGLRHTHATLLLQQGVNPKVIQER